MFSLRPVFIQDMTKGHGYKVILKCVHFFLSKKDGIDWDASISIYFVFIWSIGGFPGGSDGKKICLQCGRPGVRFPWRRECLPTPVFLPGEFHGQRSLVGYSPWGRKESDTTE